MIKGITPSGYEYCIKKETLDDMELIELIGECDENIILVPKLVKKLLGNEEKKKLFDSVRTEDGRVPSEALSEQISFIFEHSNGEEKN